MRINLDANASVRPLPEVLEFLKSYDGSALNASSVHALGQASKRIIDEAKDELRSLLQLDSEDKIIFTSGATEANNFALQENQNYKTNFIACSEVEHSSVLETMKSASKELILLNPLRLRDTAYLKQMLNDQLSQFALMAANNETGQIFDLPKITADIRQISARARIHIDAVQAVGKYKISFNQMSADTLSLSGHKLGALSGIGVLVISKNCQLNPFLRGGPQQYGLRAGTENALAIKSLAIAIRAAAERLKSSASLVEQARDKFITFFDSYKELCTINKFGDSQLPNTLSVRFDGIAADDLVVALDLEGVSVSAGSACDSGRPNASHVLLAHGLSKKQAKETIRISFEPQIDKEQIDKSIQIFRAVLQRAIELKEAA